MRNPAGSNAGAPRGSTVEGYAIAQCGKGLEGPPDRSSDHLPEKVLNCQAINEKTSTPDQWRFWRPLEVSGFELT